MPDEKYSDRPYITGPERHDELSDGVPGVVQQDAVRERKAGGKGIQKGAKVIPAMGGRARKGRTNLTHLVVLPPVSDQLKRRARFMRRATCGELARDVGKGRCGIIGSALVKLASEDMALREAALAAGQVDLARKLGESARMHLLYAREVVVKDAKSREDGAPNGAIGTPDAAAIVMREP